MTRKQPGLLATLAHHAHTTPHKVALHFGGVDTSYATLCQQVALAHATLLAQGILPGDRVAWLGLNDPAQFVLLYALAQRGAILLPLNYRLADAELLGILRHAGVNRLVVDAAHADVAKRLVLQLVGQAPAKVIPSADLMSHDMALPPSTFESANPEPATPVLLVYSSGTTGQPKGALHTHSGLVANCVLAAHAHDLTPADHVLSTLPLFHVGGLCIQTLPALYAGATVTLHPRFDAAAWLLDVQQRQPTLALMVPATLRAVLAHADFEAADLSSLRQLSAGSSTIPDALLQAFHQRGVPVAQVYGATETGPVSIYLQRQDAIAQQGSAGRPGPGVDVRLLDMDGQAVKPGDVGEIVLRAPNLMLGYWQDPDNPAFQNGWFRTGDLARCDANGFYWVVGRSKDMIISGGENIYPAEIENILASHPDILEVAVVGQPNPQWGEVAIAIVVLKPGSQFTSKSVIALCDGKLARYKHPRAVVFASSLPKTALGKAIKSELVAMLQTGVSVKLGDK
jgi:fatty-acyl-CoA synthase